MSKQLLELEEDMLTKVVKTFDKTEESLNEEVKEIQEWLKTQRHLPELMHETHVRNFYILNKCNVEKTKQKIDNYYTSRTQNRDIFDNINPNSPNIKLCLDAIYMFPFPKLSKEMYRVLYFGARDEKLTGNTTPMDILRHFINMMEIRLYEDITYGDVWCVDFKNLSMKLLLKLSPLMIYKVIITVYERVFSFRLKAFYFFNSFAFVEWLVVVLKTLKPKLANRIHVFKDTASIAKIIPKEMLPKDLGGDELSFEEIRDLLLVKLAEYQDRFDKLDEMRVDEKLREKNTDRRKILGIF